LAHRLFLGLTWNLISKVRGQSQLQWTSGTTRQQPPTFFAEFHDGLPEIRRKWSKWLRGHVHTGGEVNMNRWAVYEAVDLAIASAVSRGTRFGAVPMGFAVDGLPVFHAPTRKIAQRLKATGYKFSKWRLQNGGVVWGWH
jgi:hypothetical protein